MLVPSVPFGPVRPMEPSWPLMATEEPFLPLTVIEPLVPGTSCCLSSLLSADPKLRLSFVAIEILPLSWVKEIFLPASIVTVSPGWIKVSLLPVTAPSDDDAVSLKPELLMASATLLPVT